jgi:integrase/recombinase XerD
MLYRATQRAYQSFLLSLGRLTILPVEDPFADLRHRYRQELLDVRGFSSETVEQHERTIEGFLIRTLPGAESLRCLTAADVDRYLALRGKAVCRQRLQHVIGHLRSFLGFCHANGEIDRPLEIIDWVRIHRDELPPRALAWPLVQRLLYSIDRSSRSGWRDYAILHLAAHYGLRPSEIVALRLHSINWEDRTLTVEQRKTRSTLELPLADRTVSILQRYLKHVRPHGVHPELFLRARCPAGALTRHVINDIFDKRAAESGLSIEGYSVYSLRHAFAMRLLQRGVGLRTIGDLLGHRNLATTCQYLRLDLDTLREVALPVPTQAQA